jgi:hypothetical protein
MEFSHATDERFAAASGFAGDGAAWVAQFPELPAPDLLAKDYQSFTTAQRALVERLLLARRFTLAATATRQGRELLITHAAVSRREVELLGVAATPSLLASALQDRFARAIDAVAPSWRRGDRAALDLAPLHLAGGKAGDDPHVREGGGLLYHRPRDPRTVRPSSEPAAEAAPHAPRRFDPRDLPRGLVQLVGHSGDARCRKFMRSWLASDLPRYAAVRTVVVGDAAEDVVYRAGVHLAPTALILADPELNTCAIEDVELVELDPGSVR